ncbi:MAG TPA: hypothetical protein VLC92_14225 [Rhodocyclaceae bacterium]|nr:hypothetical protein [Rhodocyclaceae bacterium]
MRVPIIQIAFGGKNRFAARDYYEHPSAGDALLSPLAARNQRAIWDEDTFRDRFGFDAPAEQRQYVIELQCHWDLTNREVTSLYSGGCLVLGKGKATRLCPRIAVYAWGLFLLVSAVLCAALVSFRLLSFSASPHESMLLTFALYGIAVVMLWFSSRIGFEPVGILRRRGLKLGRSWILPKYSRDGSPLHTDQER